MDDPQVLERWAAYIKAGRTVVESGVGAQFAMPPNRDIKYKAATLFQRPLFKSNLFTVYSDKHGTSMMRTGETTVAATFSVALDVNCVSELCRGFQYGFVEDRQILIRDHVEALERRGVAIDVYPFILENRGRHTEKQRPQLEALSHWLDADPEEDDAARVRRWIADSPKGDNDFLPMVYLLVLRACIIANSAPTRTAPANYHELARFMCNEMHVFAGRCYSIVAQMFATQEHRFFKGLGSIRAQTIGAEVKFESAIRKCHNVAWDIAHIMTLELMAEPRFGGDFNVPALLTFDKSLAELATASEIGAICLSPQGERFGVEAVVELFDEAAEALEPFTSPALVAERFQHDDHEQVFDVLIDQSERELSRVLGL